MTRIYTHCPKCGDRLNNSSMTCYNCNWWPGQQQQKQVCLCPKCDGETVVPTTGNEIDRVFVPTRVCPTCSGKGYLII